MTDNSETAGADLAALRQDIGRLTDTIRELLRHQGRATASRVSEAADEAKERIAHGAADAQGGVRAASAELEASIERNPLMAVLIAFGIGMSFGMLSRSRG